MSHFNQGRYWYGAPADDRDDWLEMLMTPSEKILLESTSIGATFALK